MVGGRFYVVLSVSLLEEAVRVVGRLNVSFRVDCLVFVWTFGDGEFVIL